MTSVSVILPTRGRPGFLRQALASVLAQTHQPTEIIVVDDREGAAAMAREVSPTIKVLAPSRSGTIFLAPANGKPPPLHPIHDGSNNSLN